MKTLVIGLGNPLLGDDGVGIEAVRTLEQKLKDVEVITLNASGFSVVERMLGYDRVIVVDAIAGRDPGRVHVFTSEELKPTIHFTSPHDMNIQTAMELLKGLSEFPKYVKFVGIEIVPNNEFKEGLSDDVKKALPEVEKLIIEELEGGKGKC